MADVTPHDAAGIPVPLVDGRCQACGRELDKAHSVQACLTLIAAELREHSRKPPK